MRFLGRRGRSGDLPSLEQVEADPEFAAAQAAADQASPPPPSQNPYWEVIAGSTPQFVQIPHDEPREPT